jgi:hypothetical protein
MMLRMSKHVFIALTPMEAQRYGSRFAGVAGFKACCDDSKTSWTADTSPCRPPTRSVSDGTRPRTAVAGFNAAPRARCRSSGEGAQRNEIDRKSVDPSLRALRALRAINGRASMYTLPDR